MYTERVGRGGWALWLLLVVFAFWGGEARGGRAGGGHEGAGAHERGRAHAAAGGAPAMPPALRAAYLAARQAEGGAGYAVREEAGGLVADNPAQGFSVAFSAEGVALAGEGAPRATLRPVRFGCAGEMREVGRARPEVREGRVAFPREGFVEWYVNGPLGLEQGFSVEEAPRCAGAPAEALEVELSLGEGLSASLEAGGEQVALRDGAGQRVLGVSELYALDAKGNALPARLGVTSAHGVSMRVETAGAAYPVVIDPLIAKEQQRLFPSGGAVGDALGSAVALSGDTALIGGDGLGSYGHGAGAAYVFVRQGASWSQQAKLLASDGFSGDWFGISVALSGDTALVGAPLNQGNVTSVGAIYVFVRQGTSWSQQQKLFPSNGIGIAKFGTSVALSGDTALIGAPQDSEKATYAGAVYVFAHQGASWSQQQKLLPSDGADYDSFGTSVALSGDTALVGASGNDEKGQDAGAAYVFVRQGASWSQQQKLLPSDGAAKDNFGSSVALSGDTALVGAPYNAEKASYAGAAYVFVRQGASWSQQQKLLQSDGEGPYFGTSVALSGNTALIGAPYSAGMESNTGAAYVFVRQGASWSQQQKLLASDEAFADRFGISVALSGDTALVGAIEHLSAGAAYAFIGTGSSWSQQQEIASDPSANDSFGRSIAISGDTAIIGAFGLGIQGLNVGVAYVFVRQGASWIHQAKLFAPNPNTGAQFGASVAFSGNTALVGAYGANSQGPDSGEAYVFLHQGFLWNAQTLFPSDGASGDAFGYAVALSGDIALIGAYRNDAKGTDAGAAYIFVRQNDNWSQQAQIFGSDTAAGDGFGYAVALSGDTVIIGARQNDAKASDAGSAYVFVRQGSSWIQQTQLFGSDTAVGDLFGSAVALSGDTALIGAPHHGAKGQGSGASYVFVRQGTTWSSQAKLLAADETAGDAFGGTVALSGETALISSYDQDAQSTKAGAAYLFLRQGASWSQQQKLLASDGAAGDRFGGAVALSGDTALIGAPGSSKQVPQAGEAYAFVLAQICSKDTNCPAPPPEACASAVCNTTTGACGTKAKSDGAPCPAGTCMAGNCVAAPPCSKDTDCPVPPLQACAFAVCNTASKTCGTRQKLDGAPCPAGTCTAGGCLPDSTSETSSTTSASSAAGVGSAGSTSNSATSAGSAGNTGSTSPGTSAGGAGGADSGPPELHLKGGGCECATRGVPSPDASGRVAMLLLALLPLARRRSRRRP